MSANILNIHFVVNIEKVIPFIVVNILIITFNNKIHLYSYKPNELICQ